MDPTPRNTKEGKGTKVKRWNCFVPHLRNYLMLPFSLHNPRWQSQVGLLFRHHFQNRIFWSNILLCGMFQILILKIYYKERKKNPTNPTKKTNTKFKELPKVYQAVLICLLFQWWVGGYKRYLGSVCSWGFVGTNPISLISLESQIP